MGKERCDYSYKNYTECFGGVGKSEELDVTDVHLGWENHRAGFKRMAQSLRQFSLDSKEKKLEVIKEGSPWKKEHSVLQPEGSQCALASCLCYDPVSLPGTLQVFAQMSPPQRGPS